MKTCSIAQTSSTSASTHEDLINANVIITYTSLTENAEVNCKSSFKTLSLRNYKEGKTHRN